MTTENDPVLAGMLAKVAAWQAAVDSYRAARGLEQSGDSAMSGDAGHIRTAIELPVGAFRGMTIAEAVKLYLQSVRRKQTVQEIADGLRAGGLESSAKDFGPTLRGMLHRLKKNGELLRFKDGWDLAEAHSAALRNRLAREAPPSKAAKSRSKRGQKGNGKKAASKSKATTVSSKPSGPKGPTLDDRIQVFLAAHPLEWFSAKQVIEALKETNSGSTSLAFARLVRYGKIASDGGRYAAPKK